MGRTLGIPNDVVDATEHLLRMADEFEPRRVDLGRVNDRHFVFAAGVGLDASVVERVDAPPATARRASAPGTTATPPSTIFTRRYLVNPPRVRVAAGGRTLEGVTVIVQNSDPFTYFRKRPIRVGDGRGARQRLARRGRAEARHGARAARRLVPRLLSGRARTVLRHRQVESFAASSRALRVEAIDARGLPRPGGRRLHRRVRRGRVRRGAGARCWPSS